MSDVKGKTGAVLRETAVLTGAVAIIAAGVFFFLVPSHTSVSSISGLGDVYKRQARYAPPAGSQ